jgi:hypothetical protein
MRKFRVCSVDDSRETCECCGRRGLKKVVGLLPLNEDGEVIADPVYFGAVCAGRACGWTYTRTDGTTESARAARRADRELAFVRNELVSDAMKVQAWFEKHGLVSYVSLGFMRGFSCLTGDPVIYKDRYTINGDDIDAARARLVAQFPLFDSWSNLKAMNVEEFRALIAVHRNIIASYLDIDGVEDADQIAAFVILFPTRKWAWKYAQRFGAAALRNLLDQYEIPAEDARRVAAAQFA